MLHSTLQRQMEELTAAGILHEADFNERVLDALHCLPLANAQVLSWHCPGAAIRVAENRHMAAPLGGFLLKAIYEHQPRAKTYEPEIKLCFRIC